MRDHDPVVIEMRFIATGVAIINTGEVIFYTGIAQYTGAGVYNGRTLVCILKRYFACITDQCKRAII